MTAVCGLGFNWAFNSLRQSPCQIAEYLAGACTNTSIGIGPLDPLSPQDGYTGPAAGLQNPCVCSTVFYSELSACAACQSHNFTSWSQFTQNCTNVHTGSFPGNIPNSTVIPDYAYQNVTATNTFNVSLADGSATSAQPSSTSTGSTGKSKSNGGAIAGGVVGGIVFIILVAGLTYWFNRRRHSRGVTLDRVDLNADGESFMPPIMSTTSPSPFSTIQTPKLYDPSDPSTFPPPLDTPVAYTPDAHPSNYRSQFGSSAEL